MTVTQFQRPGRPAPEQPIGASTQVAHDAMQAILIHVDQAFRDSEAKWGVGRLPNLVGPDTLLAWRRGWDAYQGAINAGDVEALRTVAPKMRAALAFMDGEAARLGHASLAPVVWETLLPDGTVLCVVRTGAEASAVATSGRKCTVWTLDEIARVLPRGVADVKLEFPGAAVTAVTQRSEGYAQDWVTSDPILEYLHPEVA